MHRLGIASHNVFCVCASGQVLDLRRGPGAFTPVGGRAAHDHTLVAAGEWREFPLFGNGTRYEQNCVVRCRGYIAISHAPHSPAIIRRPRSACRLTPAGARTNSGWASLCLPRQRTPVTTRTMEQCTPAIELAMAGGGETLFSTLKVGGAWALRACTQTRAC